MRKWEQEKLLELLTGMDEGFSLLEIPKPELEQAALFLQDTVDSMNAIGAFLSSSLSAARVSDYENDFSAISSLLEPLAAALVDGADPKVYAGQIRRHIARLKDILACEEEIEIEIVFFPYKSSMWDSLESIWRAASQYPRCRCYVVPIPYYDKEENGAFGKRHYEGDCFPVEVPITSYKDYSLATHRPDIAYIHNPYNQKNFISTVDPQYYTTELKKYVSLLVYVPYYTLLATHVDEMFYAMPALAQVDKIVVWNKDVREDFLRVHPAEKVVALGSPKFDHLRMACKKKAFLPAGWEAKLQGKRVVFYNTSVGAFLRGAQEYLSKLQYTFSLFENDEDFVLWWRPHPLMEASFRAVSSTLGDMYRSLVEDYIEKDFGIYDVLPTADAALCHGDIYYGDSSSLCVLWYSLGKPVILQSCDILSSRKMPQGRMSLLPFAVALDQNRFVFIPRGLNCLFEARLSGGGSVCLGPLPRQRLLSLEYKASCVCEERIFFAPFRSSEILIYHSDSGTMEKIPLSVRHMGFLFGPASSFSDILKCGNSLFFVPEYYRALVEYRLDDGKLVYHDIMKELPFAAEDGSTPLFGRGAVLGAQLILPCLASNSVFVFDTGKKRGDCHPVGDAGCSYGAAAAVGDVVWLAPAGTGPFVQWTMASRDFRLFSEFPGEYKQYSSSFHQRYFEHLVPFGEGLLAFPGSGDFVLHIGMEEKAITVFDSIGVPKGPAQAFSKFSQVAFANGRLYAFSAEENLVWVVDEATGETERISLSLSEKEWNDFYISVPDTIFAREHEREHKLNIMEASLPEPVTDFIRRYFATGHGNDVALGEVAVLERFSTNLFHAGEAIHRYIMQSF